MPTKPFLPVERKKTDSSLHAERDKTNESLRRSRAVTERKIDDAVVVERAAADLKTQASREGADTDRDVERSLRNYDREEERGSSDDRLQEERHRADLAIELERNRVDVAIDSERVLKSELSKKLLERERQITDTNLKDERFKTDSEVTKEASELAITKLNLTSRDEFLAIVSHDLRNPIGAASTAATFLIDDENFAHLSPEVQHWIRFIKRNIETSLRLIADLVDVERIAQGKGLVVPKMNAIKSIFDDVIADHAFSAQSKSIELAINEIDAEAQAFCDRDRIHQVLSNLIGNAIKFTPVGGKVQMKVTISEEEVSCSVADSGPGIDPSEVLKIFDRFAQLQSKDRTGLGLGLYIAKMLIEAHGGKIWAESRLGEGCVFAFKIPRRSRNDICVS